MPNDAYNSSLIRSAYPYGTPHGLGGNTQLYESKGGYIPEKHWASVQASESAVKFRGKKRAKKLHGGRQRRQTKKQRNARRRRTARKP